MVRLLSSRLDCILRNKVQSWHTWIHYGCGTLCVHVVLRCGLHRPRIHRIPHLGGRKVAIIKYSLVLQYLWRSSSSLNSSTLPFPPCPHSRKLTMVHLPRTSRRTICVRPPPSPSPLKDTTGRQGMGDHCAPSIPAIHSTSCVALPESTPASHRGPPNDLRTSK
jgi:hypothetical protein